MPFAAENRGPLVFAPRGGYNGRRFSKKFLAVLKKNGPPRRIICDGQRKEVAAQRGIQHK